MLLVTLSSFVFPLHFVANHCRDAINDLPIRCVWIWDRLWNIAHFVITVWLVIRMTDDHREIRYWEIALARNLIESFAVAQIIDILCHASSRFFAIPPIPPNKWVPKYALIALYVAAYVQWYSLPFAVVIAVFVGLWLAVALIIYVVARKVEIVQNESEGPSLQQLLDGYRIDALPWWNPVAIVRPSYFASKFFPVICESSDGSSILVLEKWRRNSELDITVWRVSTLNGRQKEVIKFGLANIPEVLLDVVETQGFESHGLIFIGLTVPTFGSWLIVKDQRRLREAVWSYLFTGWKSVLDASRIERHVDSDGKVRGYRVRVVGYQPSLCVYHDTDHYRPTIVVTTFDLLADQSPMIVVREEEFEAGPCLGFNEESKQIRCFRTGRGVSGFFRIMPDGSYGRLVFFNRSDSTFGTLNDVSELWRIDRSFALYVNTPAPGHRFVVEGIRLMPALLTEEEWIEVAKNGVIYRSIFPVSSLRRLALVAVFRQWPELPDRMNAIEFRAETGIGGLEDEFGS